MNELEGRELDEKVATEVMGWLVDKENYSTWVAITDTYWIRPLVDSNTRVFGEWKPSTDIAAAYQVEERIKELGLVGNYCKYLNYMADAKWEAGDHSGRSWQIIHASPEERCRAALMAAEAEK